MIQIKWNYLKIRVSGLPTQAFTLKKKKEIRTWIKIGKDKLKKKEHQNSWKCINSKKATTKKTTHRIYYSHE